jgi:DNA-binding CsgD family transcriptional regulator
MTRQPSAVALATCETAATAPQAEVLASAAMRSISAPLAQFGAHTASFTSQALRAQWTCFYYLDGDGEPFGFQVHRTPWALRESYLRHNMARSDPTHPASLVAQNLRFVSVFDHRLRCGLESRRNYWSFLSSFGTRDAAEMIFRVSGRAVAGMSLLWVGQPGMGSDRELGEALHSYIELNLGAHYGPLPGELASDIALTDRELEIVQLVCHGLTNARVAQRLNIGLATVKTHLLHVFEKLGVRTRAELVRRCLCASPAGKPFGG